MCSPRSASKKPVAFESDNKTVAVNNLHRVLYTWWTLHDVEGAEYEEVAEHGEGWGVIGGEEQGVRGRPETVAAVSVFDPTSRMLTAVLLPWAKPLCSTPLQSCELDLADDLMIVVA